MTTQRTAVYTSADVDIINDIITKYKNDPISFDEMSMASLYEDLPESTYEIPNHENWSRRTKQEDEHRLEVVGNMRRRNENIVKIAAMERELKALLMQGEDQYDVMTSKRQLTNMDSQGTIIEIETLEAETEHDVPPPTPSTISTAGSIYDQDDFENDIEDGTCDEALTRKMELTGRLLDDAERTGGWIGRVRSPSLYSDLEVIQRIINESTEASTSDDATTISNSADDSSTTEGTVTSTAAPEVQVPINITTTTTTYTTPNPSYSIDIIQPTSKHSKYQLLSGVCRSSEDGDLLERENQPRADNFETHESLQEKQRHHTFTKFVKSLINAFKLIKKNRVGGFGVIPKKVVVTLTTDMI
ncbi:hypothetical protein HDU76_000811 [Blyttiomyces sp. JEL0837]|nr:hypothetical protein HDU76_000811 [Blyttiomyces sp. JEL0837]